MRMRPREKLAAHGAHTLSDDELLAVVLRCGTRHQPVEQLAKSLLEQLGGLPGLGSVLPDELPALCQLGPVRAMTLTAMMELARRWAQQWSTPQLVIDSSRALFQHVAIDLKDRAEEYFLVLALDSRNRVLRTQWLSRGDRMTTLASPRAVFAVGLACQAVTIAVVHNHPSGDPAPSAADTALTMLLHETGTRLQLPLLDHLIVGGPRYFSFRDEGLLVEASDEIRSPE